MTPRLSQQTLDRLPPSVRRPTFDPSRLTTGIVHLGIGAFARAHLAAYTHPLLAADPSWGIAGVSLRSPGTRDALAPQDWLYSRVERDDAGDTIDVMAALTGILVAPDDPEAVLAAMADPQVRIVSITVSEKGYHRRAADGALDDSNPMIQADLRNPSSPRTVAGLIVAALKRRRATKLPPFTVLCCDNIPENGTSTKALIATFARLLGPELGRLVENEVAFPNCMVDRIVPATTDDDRTLVQASLGVHDAWPVICEPFSQWVVEDRFPLGRPRWEETGVEMVDDVRPYEAMKLRLLNGSHSAIAYLGQLAGWETVADAIADASLAGFVRVLMQEAAAILRMPASTDVNAYQRALLRRFGNGALRHRTAQISIDGSQKVPMRILSTAQDRRAAGLPSPCVALVVAAWLRFLQGRRDDGSSLTMDDPKGAALSAIAQSAATPAALCAAIFALRDIVPPALAEDASFRGDVIEALEDLTTHGVRKTLMKIMQGEKRHENGSDDLGAGAHRRDVGGAGARRAGRRQEPAH